MSPTRKNHWLFPFLLLIVLTFIAFLMVYMVPVKAPKVISASFPTTAIDPQIRIEFSELMDQKSVELAFRINPYVEGKMSWAGRLFAFTPNEPLQFDERYTVLFEAGVISQREQKLAKYENTFHTPKKNFLYLDNQGVLQRYSFAAQSAVNLPALGAAVTQYDYDPHSNQVVALVQNPNMPGEGINCLYIISLKSLKLKPREIFCERDDFAVHTAKFLPFESALMIVGSNIVDYDDGLSGPSIYPEDTKLIRYDLDNDTQTMVRTGAALTYGMYPSPDGLQVLLIDDSGSLLLKDLQSDREQFIVKDFLSVFGFSEYGSHILYTITGEAGIFDFYNNLVMLGADGTKQLLLENAQGSVNHPSLASDKSAVVYKFLPEQELGEAVAFQLVLKNLEDDTFHNITTSDDGPIDQPVFSPDGREIAFIQFPNDPSYSDPIAGYNEFENTFVTGEIRLYDLETEQIIITGVQGSDVRWVY